MAVLNCLLEMILDWWAFSWSLGNLKEIFNWWSQYEKYINLHPNSRRIVENILDQIHEKLVEMEQ